MTRTLLNTLFVGTEGAYARLENDTVRVELEGNKLVEVPLHHLGSLVLFGNASASTPLLMRCAEDGRGVTLLDRHGRFRARIVGKTSGNCLLRQAQYEAHRDPGATLEVARRIVAGKLQNVRQTLLRGAREAASHEAAARLAAAANAQAIELANLSHCQSVDEARGHEGLAAAAYFNAFDDLIRVQRTDFRFDERSRRPPRDRTNALLSFVYSLATNDCVTALEGVGLDPQFGFLHALRPGRPALALDLVEEFRSLVLDRLVLTLINRKQIVAPDFDPRDGGSVMLTDEGRKKLLTEYQNRKKIEVRHPLLKEKVPLGLLPHLQARLLARHLRGDLPHYLPWGPV
ncbi:MAG: subtype I-C CRISPR-associated endonuclease Cas1 [Armatimonadota bacterium]